MPKTLKDQFEEALARRGEFLVKRNFKHNVWTRRRGGYYYVGRAGGLRFGPNSAGSRPVSDQFKQILQLENSGISTEEAVAMVRAAQALAKESQS